MITRKFLMLLYVIGGLLLILEITIIDDFDKIYQKTHLFSMIFILILILVLEIKNKWFK